MLIQAILTSQTHSSSNICANKALCTLLDLTTTHTKDNHEYCATPSSVSKLDYDNFVLNGIAWYCLVGMHYTHRIKLHCKYVVVCCQIIDVNDIHAILH